MANPFVSIIIPVFNEEKYLGQCLQAIKDLDYPADLIEIILVDNGSTDNTLNIARGFKARIDQIIGVNVSALRNRGAAMANGEILAFLDADCLVRKDWIKNALTHLTNPKTGLVGCTKCLLPSEAFWIERIWGAKTKKTEGYVNWVSSKNMVISRKNFEMANGFNKNISSCEDWMLCLRLQELGLGIYSSVDVAVVHCKLRKNLKHFFLKELWYGKDMLRAFFIGNFQLEYFKSLLFALFYACCLLGIVISLIYFLMTKNYLFLTIFLSGIIFTPFLLAIKKSSKKKSIMPLSLLYLLYGIARAISIFNINNWLITKTTRSMPKIKQKA